MHAQQAPIDGSDYGLPKSCNVLEVLVAAIEAGHLVPTLEPGKSLQWCYAAEDGAPVLKTTKHGTELGVVAYASLPKVRPTDSPATKTLSHFVELTTTHSTTLPEVPPCEAPRPLPPQQSLSLRSPH